MARIKILKQIIDLCDFTIFSYPIAFEIFIKQTYFNADLRAIEQKLYSISNKDPLLEVLFEYDSPVQFIRD